MTRQILDEILEVSAAYRGRHGTWPTQVRLDAERFQALARASAPDTFKTLSARVLLGTRDTGGVSAGGQSVVQLGEPVDSELRSLAATWLGDITLETTDEISMITDYWVGLADDALRNHLDVTELNAEHLIDAHPSAGPLEQRDPDRRAAETLFYLAYIASFGLRGVHPKQLAIGRLSYGWQPSEHGELVLSFHQSNGRVSSGPPFEHLTGRLTAPRSRWRDAVLQFAEEIAEVTRGLAR